MFKKYSAYIVVALTFSTLVTPLAHGSDQPGCDPNSTTVCTVMGGDPEPTHPNASLVDLGSVESVLLLLLTDLAIT